MAHIIPSVKTPPLRECFDYQTTDTVEVELVCPSALQGNPPGAKLGQGGGRGPAWSVTAGGTWGQLSASHITCGLGTGGTGWWRTAGWLATPHYHLRSWYRRYWVMEGGRFSSSSRASRGFPTACLITRRHKSINGNGSAGGGNGEVKRASINPVRMVSPFNHRCWITFKH